MTQHSEAAYKPDFKNAEILEVALAYVNSVPYQVSARWLFYRLLQDGKYSGKEDYKSKFLPTLSKARKAFYSGWRPDTLVDETRSAIERGWGHRTTAEWLRVVKRHGVSCRLDLWQKQKNYLEVWFEAAAMQQQFEHYTDHITLLPFRGDPSISFKWDTAKRLERKAAEYERPIIILYFGDLDPKGLKIPESALADIRDGRVE